MYCSPQATADQFFVLQYHWHLDSHIQILGDLGDDLPWTQNNRCRWPKFSQQCESPAPGGLPGLKALGCCVTQTNWFHSNQFNL